MLWQERFREEAVHSYLGGDLLEMSLFVSGYTDNVGTLSACFVAYFSDFDGRLGTVKPRHTKVKQNNLVEWFLPLHKMLELVHCSFATT